MVEQVAALAVQQVAVQPELVRVVALVAVVALAGERGVAPMTWTTANMKVSCMQDVVQ